MNESWEIGAHWRPREESALALAHRLEKFLELASAACPTLGRWYQTGSRKSKNWDQPVNTFDKEAIERLIAKKYIKNDDGEPVEWGGYSMGLISSITDKVNFSGMSLYIGTKAPTGRYYMANSVTIRLHDDLAIRGLQNEDDMKRYMAAIIISWEPDWAVLYRYDSPGFNRRPKEGPFLDKMAWAGPPFLAQAASLGEDGVTVDVLAGGTLYTRLNPPPIPPRQPIKPGRLD